MKANTTLFCDVRKYRVFILYTRDDHNVTCQFHLGQNKHIINKRQVRGAGERACNTGSNPGDLGLRVLLRRPGAQRPGWTVAPPRGSVNFRTPPPTVMHGKYLPSRQFAVLFLACPACSSQPCFCPHVPTSGDQGPPPGPGSPQA